MLMTKLSRFNSIFTASLKVLTTFFQFLIELTREFLSLLFGRNEEPTNNKATENAAQGGILNYRTGRFDDGTDAAGWYEKD